MKPFFRLPLLAAALASLFLLGSTLTRADDDDQSHRAAAEALLTAMHTDRMVAASTNQLVGLVDRVHQNETRGATLTPEQSGALQQAEDEAKEAIRKSMGFDSIKEEFIKTYADNFSEAEIKELTGFYNSPTGQKLIDKQPVVADQMRQLAQRRMQAAMPGIVAKLREAIQKIVPPPALPATAVPAPTAPAAPNAPIAPGVLTTPVPPTTPVPATTPVTPTAVTPPVTTSPVPAIPTPLPTAAASTPSAQ